MSVVQIHQPKTFTLQSANALLPIILRITRQSHDVVQRILKSNLKSEELVNTEVQTWQRKMKALGVDGKGLWLVDFDTGTEYLCWKYPETSVSMKHRYTEGFQSRIHCDPCVESIDNAVDDATTISNSDLVQF